MLKWILYILGLIGFLWFVFIRNSSVLDLNKDASGKIIIGQYADSSQELTENEAIYLDDEASFIDEEDEIAPSDSQDEELPADTTEFEEDENGLDEESAFLIVVGSFSDKANAEKMLKTVLKDGHEGKMVYKAPMYRVIAAATNDLADAKQLQNHFTHAYKVKAFVLKN